MHRLFIATGVIQTLAAALAAQSPLTTAYATTSGGAVGGGVYFDLTVHSGQVITRLDGNYGQMPGTSGSIDVFVRPGTSAGFEGSSAGWTLAGSAPVTAEVAKLTAGGVKVMVSKSQARVFAMSPVR